MRIIFIVLSFLISVAVFAENKESKKADKLFETGDFQGAIEMYGLALEKENDPVEKARYKFRTGEANFRLNKLDKAEKNLNDAIKQGYMNPDVYMLLGDVQLKLGKTNEALTSYESYRLANPGDVLIPIKIASVTFANENRHNLSLFKLEPLAKVNSKKNDFGVNYFNESLIFSTNKITSTDEEEEEEEHDNRFSDRTIPKKEKTKSYTKTGLERTVAMLAVGKSGENTYGRPMEIAELNKLKDFPDDGIFVYDGYSQSLLYTHLDGKRAYVNIMKLTNNQWKKSEKIEIASQGFHVGHPCMSPDGNRIYFVSKMPGGRGKSDIWYIVKTGGTWSGTPINAGNNINTAGNELFPHISDGYMFFSSDGRVGIGGFDIFVSKITASGFDRPINLGSPFNSPADDYNLVIKLNKKEGMLVSSRNPKNGDDIFAFDGFPSNLSITGKITDVNSGTPISNVSLELFIEKKSLNKVVSDQNGDFVIPVIPNTTYRLNASVPGYAAAEKTFTSPDELYARVNKESGVNLDFALQSNAAVITGKVYDIQTLTPMEGAIVTLVAGNTVQQTKPVDPSGIYKFSNLSNNTDYTVKVDPKGYFLETRRVHVTNSSQRFEYTKNSGHDLDFALQKFTLNKEIIIPKLFFQEDKANILTESYEEMNRLAEIFKQNRHCNITLRGHIDVGIKNDIANKLSLLRVNAVKDYLTAKGVDPAQLTVIAMGRSNPLVRNPVSADERQLNNRITYTVTKVDAVKELEYSLPPSSSSSSSSSGLYNGGSSVQPSTNRPQTQPAQTQPSQTTTAQGQSTNNRQQPVQPQGGSDNLPFIVQVSSSGVLDMKNPDFAKIRSQLGYEVKYVLADDGKYKYYIGGFETLTEAKDMVGKLKSIGIKNDPWPRSRYK